MDEAHNVTTWRGKRVIVTGGAGFLGSHLVRRLVRDGAEVTVLDRARAPTGLQAAANDETCAHIELDLENRQAVRRVMGRLHPQVMVHLAGRVDLSRTPEVTDLCLRGNVLTTGHLLWEIKDRAIESFVYASSTEVYGRNPIPFHEAQIVDPPSPYAISKVAAEHLCQFFYQAYGVPTVTVRMSTVYGPGQSAARLIPSAILAIRRNAALPMTRGEHCRDFLYVDDAVDGLLRAAAVPAARGQVINLGHEEPVSLRAVIEIIRHLMGTSWQPQYGALPSRVGEAAVWSSRCAKAREVLGWQPRIGMEEGLARVIDAFQASDRPPMAGRLTETVVNR